MTATTATRNTTINIPMTSQFAGFSVDELQQMDEGLASANKSWLVVSNTDKGHAKVSWAKDVNLGEGTARYTAIGGKAKQALKDGTGIATIVKKYKGIVALREAIKAELAMREDA